ncbi:MAG: TonB-dependent receptor [Gemmatimonadales bacterium]|nr:MAG: TonB-dependent receptor [Gemmatimonadales bacterium]
MPRQYPPARTSVGAALLAALLALVPSPASAQETGSIRGQVTSATLGPAAGVTVRLVGRDRSVTTDEVGRFSFTGLVAGSYVVEVEDERLGRGSAQANLAVGDEVEVEILVSPLFEMDALVVTAGPLATRQDELFQAARVVGGRELRSRIQPSLGETLASEPGISSTYFGPGSSRPIIRGLGGDRVRILENGVGTGDASNTSPDHAVSVDPATADRIEVVRGPATLLYGSSAIGGVVNVLDGRIPRERPDRQVRGELLGVGGSVADERSTSGHLEVDLGEFVVRGSGSWRNTGDYDIPGFAELGHDEAEHAEGEHAEEEVEGLLPNSFTENTTFSAGASWLGNWGYLGAAISGYDQLYGVPGGHAHAEEPAGGTTEEEEEVVTVDLRQRRFDASGEYRFSGAPLEAVRFRFGANDYRHFELEGPEIGTIFQNDQWEGRLEARHRPWSGFEGALGFQAMGREFSTIGAEAFTPPNETDLYAAFIYEEADVGPARIQLGARYEWQESRTVNREFSRDFQGVSASTGIRWDPGELVSLSLSGGRSVKLPTAEELFSNGPHLATRSFELGNPDLTEEVAYSLDATLHFHLDDLRAEISGFVNDFSDYIYPAFTGAEQEGLREVRYSQGDARFVGLEARGEVELFHVGEQHLGLELTADVVQATLKATDEPLPRIPPFSLGAGLRYQGMPWQASLSVREVAEQDRVAPFEEPTPGYVMVDATVGYRLFAGNTVHELVLQARNLTDTDARTHASLLKQEVPLPGRDLRIMYRVAF